MGPVIDHLQYLARHRGPGAEYLTLCRMTMKVQLYVDVYSKSIHLHMQHARNMAEQYNQREWPDGKRHVKYSVTEDREYLSANQILEEKSSDDALKLLIN